MNKVLLGAVLVIAATSVAAAQEGHYVTPSGEGVYGFGNFPGAYAYMRERNAIVAHDETLMAPPEIGGTTGRAECTRGQGGEPSQGRREAATMASQTSRIMSGCSADVSVSSSNFLVSPCNRGGNSSLIQAR